MRRGAFTLRRASASALLSAALLALFDLGAAHAGAWTQESGRGLAILTFVYDSANAAFESRDVQGQTTDFTKYEADLYTEYGVSDRFTVVFRAPYQRIVDRSGDETQRLTGAGEVELAVRANLWRRGGFVVSAQPLIGFPGEARGGGQAPLEAAGRFYEGRLLLGWGGDVGGRDVFWSADGGYRIREGPAPDEWRADAAIGLSVRPSTKLIAQSFNTVSAGEARAPFADFRSHKVQASAVQRVSDSISLQFGGFRTVAGENVIKEVGGFTALWWEFRP